VYKGKKAEILSWRGKAFQKKGNAQSGGSSPLNTDGT